MTLAFLALLGAPYIYDINSLRVKITQPPLLVEPRSAGNINVLAWARRPNWPNKQLYMFILCALDVRSGVIWDCTNRICPRPLQYWGVILSSLKAVIQLDITFISNSAMMRKRLRLRNTVCPTHYRNRHFFNNFATNEDIAAPCLNN